MKSLPLTPKQTVVFFSQENEREYIAVLRAMSASLSECEVRNGMNYLLPRTEEKFVWIDSIADGAANEGYPVENDWRFVWLFDEKMLKHIDQNCKTQIVKKKLQ